MGNTVSIIVPAKNEAASLPTLLAQLQALALLLDRKVELIVVNDGSSDATSEICKQNKVFEVKHPYSKGNGAAVKSGAIAATGEVLVFLDADGQHNPDDIPKLLDRLNAGYDMVVGARRSGSQASVARKGANRVYNLLASYITGQRVDDLTSGFRAVRANKFRQYLYLLPNGFSYPTTITMAFFRAGYSVAYEPIDAEKRTGKSHLQPWKDGWRFLLIIFKVGTLYSPLKLFTPLALIFFLSGLAWYGYTFATMSRFTNMSALLMTTSTIIFMMGLISEQITALMYKDANLR